MTFQPSPWSVFQRHTLIDFQSGFVPTFVIPSTTSLNPNIGTQGQTVIVTATGVLYDSHTTFSLGAGIAISAVIVSSTQATLTITISPTAVIGFRNLTTTGLSGPTVLVNAFDVFTAAISGTGDFFDYIFQFQDRGSFLLDPAIQQFLPLLSNSQPGGPLLIFNPVEALQPPRPAFGNALVFLPQLAQSAVPLPGFWGMLTIQSTAPIPEFVVHPNLQILNDRTLMFRRVPSVLISKIDISHINIIIDTSGVYVSDGLSLVAPAITYVGPGDVLGANLFTAYWGFRAFSSATIGNKAVQLRRSSDSTTMDFVTLANGTLDAASITAFKGAGTLTVAKMYDQTGNGHDLVPTNSTFEQAFTQNVLNGMGVYNNLVPNATAYRANTTFTILNTWSNSFFSVFNSHAFAIGDNFSFQNVCASGDDEIGLILDRDAAYHSITIKNEGGNFDGGIANNNVPEGVWHVAVGVVDQNVGSQDSFIYVDNQVPIPNITEGALYGNPNNLFATICLWGEDGAGPDTNVLVGYGAEAAWFATPTPNAPWTQAQAAALIANAKAFWGI